MTDVRLPGNSHRLVVFGRTGTGKTQAGVFQLSLKNFLRNSGAIPWVVVNTKRDELLREIERMSGARTIDFMDTPGKSGLYFINPLPHEMRSPQAEQFLWRVHQRGRVGLFFDEGLMLDRYSTALEAIYSQGRSLRIPTITLSQKPKYMMQLTFSEADFFQVFPLNDANDRKRVAEFMPPLVKMPPDGRSITIEPGGRLQDFHSLWYDVARHSVAEFSPVPARDQILERFEAQLRAVKRVI
jgi:hypothetical protein